MRLVKAARGADNYHYVFTFDRGAFPLNEKVIADFPFSKEIIRVEHRYKGNSFNLLNAYKYAVELNPELIYLIEEDIFIADDFFDFHEAIWREENPFFVSACKNHHLKKVKAIGGDYEAYKFPFYQSLGVSFKPESLEIVLNHHNDDYYKFPFDYLKKNFKGYKGIFGWEQDGLIDRVVYGSGAYGIYPYSPRCYHAGFVGYSRVGNDFPVNENNYKDIATRLLLMNDTEMNSRARIHKDIEKCPTTGLCTKEIKIHDDFHTK